MAGVFLRMVGSLVDHALVYQTLAWYIRFRYWMNPPAREDLARFGGFHGIAPDSPTCRSLYIHARINRVYYYLDLFALANATSEKLASKMVLVDRHHFDAIRDSGAPVLFLQLHSGSFYMLTAWLALHWQRTNVIFVNQSRFRQWVHKTILSRFVPRHLDTSYHEIVRTLRLGESCLIMFDGGVFKPKHSTHIVVNARDLFFPTSSIAMARETGCYVLPVLSSRLAWNRVQFRFFEAIPPGASFTMEQIFGLYYPEISKDPTQWYVLIENLKRGEQLRSQQRAPR